MWRQPAYMYDQHGPYMVFESQSAKGMWERSHGEKFYTRKFVKGEEKNQSAQNRELAAASNIVRQSGYANPPQNEASSSQASTNSSGPQHSLPLREPPREFRPTTMPTERNITAPAAPSKPSLGQRILNKIKN